jgi:hypothetical protein
VLGRTDARRASNAVAPTALGRGELAAAVFAGVLIAAAMHWPIPIRIGTEIPSDLGDPLFQAWQVAWGGHALIHQPLDYFQSNAFWPLKDSLAFSDALVGYAPAGLIGRGPEAAVVRYNLLFLFAYALAFLGPYLLARELGVGRIGGLVAGAAFAYAPWRLAQDGHLHVLSSGGIPLCLFLLLRGYRTRRPLIVFAGWLIACWQVLLGFTLGLQLLYLLGALGLVAAVALATRRLRVGRPVAAATAVGLVALAGTTVLLSRPYLEVRRDHPEARRTEPVIRAESPQLRSYLTAPADNLLWGAATKRFLTPPLTHDPQEKTLFPGLAVLMLAAVGTFSAVYSRRLRTGLVVGVAVCAMLALGISRGGVRLPFEPYRLLFDYGPGWQGIRTPGRLNTLTSLGLALLAAAGAQALTSRLRRRAPGGGPVALGAGAVIVVAILAEGAGFRIGTDGSAIAGPPHARVPPPPAGQRDAPAPQQHLPIEPSIYLLWSTDGFPAITDGVGAFEPRFTQRLRAEMRAFPNPESVSRLRSLGVRTVIFHPDLAAGTPWERVAARPVQGLPLRRETKGGVVLFHLAPR